MMRWFPLVWLVVGIVIGVAAFRIWQGAPAADVVPPPPATRPPSGPPAPAVPPTEPAEAPPLPQITLERGKLTGTDETGQRQWELATGSLSVQEAQQRVVLGRVTGRFFKQGAPQVTVAAARAVYFLTSKDLELTGGVTAQTTDGRTLRAPRVRWEAGRKRLVASGGVVLTQRGMVIRADQVISDIDLKNTTFSGNVVVTVSGP